LPSIASAALGKQLSNMQLHMGAAQPVVKLAGGSGSKPHRSASGRITLYSAALRR